MGVEREGDGADGDRLDELRDGNREEEYYPKAPSYQCQSSSLCVPVSRARERPRSGRLLVIVDRSPCIVISFPLAGVNQSGGRASVELEEADPGSLRLSTRLVEGRVGVSHGRQADHGEEA